VSTLGERLAALRQRSGLTLGEIAVAASYRGRSSVQKFFAADYNPPFLDRLVAKRLARAFVGKGSPPISAAEVYELTGDAGNTAEDFKFAKAVDIERDVGVYIASFIRKSSILKGQPPLDSYAIEMDNPVKYVWHPPALTNSKGVYAIRFFKGALVPRYKPGELLFLDAGTPAKLGDDVCINFDEIQDPEGGSQESSAISFVLFGTVERQTVDHVHLRTIDGDTTFFVRHDEIGEMHRIISISDALQG
jgi:hypothetical protein